MIGLLVVFLALQVVFSADPNCGPGYKYFKRTPTAKNGNTTHWCLGVFRWYNVGNRDRARAYCNNNGSMLSIPENRKEFEALATLVRNSGLPAKGTAVAMDGQLSPKCKGLIFQKTFIDFDANYPPGECNLKNRLFLFDDAHSDPNFIFNNFDRKFPDVKNTVADKVNPEIDIQWMGECLTLINFDLNLGNKTKTTRSDLCVGEKAADLYTNDALPKQAIDAVICGRPPL